MITPNLVGRAAKNRGLQVIDLLLSRATSQQGASISVSREMIVSAASNSLYGHDLLLSFQARANGRRLPFDDPVVLTVAASEGSLQTVMLLIRNPLEQYSSEIASAMASNPDWRGCGIRLPPR